MPRGAGILAAGRPLSSYLPPGVAGALRRLEGVGDERALTVRRLLNHTSGLPDYFFDPDFQRRVRAQPARSWRPEELVQAAVERGRLRFSPGTEFSYGDTGYVLVGMAIEQMLNCRLGDAYRSLVFAPLSMEATYLEWHESARGGEVSHHYDGDEDLQRTNTSYDWAGGGLVTTGQDLVRFLQGLFRGVLLDRRWLEELLRWRAGLKFRSGSSARYRRYGLGVGTNVACGHEIIGATGVWGAFGYYWPAGEAAIAGTVNLRGMDRQPLLAEVLCALSRRKRGQTTTLEQARRASPPARA